MDDVHRTELDGVLALHGLRAFNAQDRWQIHRACYGLDTWPDFPAALNRLKRRFPVVSFTMLPLAMAVAVSRRNDIDWDAVISCEMIGVYKPQPEAYGQVATWLGLEPAQILMVACHNFDLNAARASGYQTPLCAGLWSGGRRGHPIPIPIRIAASWWTTSRGWLKSWVRETGWQRSLALS